MNISQFMPFVAFALLVNLAFAEPVEQKAHLVNADLIDLGDLYRNALVVAEKPLQEELVSYPKLLAAQEIAIRKSGDWHYADQFGVRLKSWNGGVMPDGTSSKEEMIFILGVRKAFAKTAAMTGKVIERLNSEGKVDQAKMVKIRLEALRAELHLDPFDDATKNQKTIPMVFKLPDAVMNALQEHGSRADAMGFLKLQGVEFPDGALAVCSGSTLVVRTNRNGIFAIQDLIDKGPSKH